MHQDEYLLIVRQFLFDLPKIDGALWGRLKIVTPEKESFLYHR